MQETVHTSTHDLVIVGGGIGGVIALRYARAAGLSAVLLERQAGVGGLWRQVPAWQDLQLLKEDWTLGDIPIGGEDARSVVANIQAWVDRFGLADAIRTDCSVTGAAWTGNHWEVQSTRGPLRGSYLVTATGAHNRARIPEVERLASSVAEFHSSALHDPTVLCGKRVVVVGGGASAQDVLVQALEHRASALHWVYRSILWFIPTRRRKHEAVGLRALGKQQLLGASPARISAGINELVGERFRRFDIMSLKPTYAFDFTRHQLIPGRAPMLSSLADIGRSVGEVARLEGSEVLLKSGERLPCDVLVWATGYELDLSYLGLADLTTARRPRDVARQCYSLTRAKNHPNLFIFGSALLDTNGSAPFFYAHLAKAVAAHIRGRRVFAERVIDHQLNYFDLVRMLAKVDPRSYPPLLWRLPYLRRLWRTDSTQPLPLP